MSCGGIRTPAAYLKAALRRRTERFDACFPRGIAFGDVDSFVEVGGHFLVIEWKLGDQVLPRGQGLALARLAKQPRTTVWVLWTDADGTITHGLDMAKPHRCRVATDEDRVGDAIRRWVAAAEGVAL